MDLFHGRCYPKQALAIAAKNGNTLWADVIAKEMENVRAAFDISPNGKTLPIGHQFV